MAQRLDLTGQIFTRLTVLEFDHSDSIYRRFWRCQCQCDAIVVVDGHSLRIGNTQSCGCLHKEIVSANGTHHLSHTPEYQVWVGIISRCENPKNSAFRNYGARGLAFEPDFRASFVAFLEHVGERPTPKHTIERIDNSLGYIRGNMRWATRREQNHNKRNNRYLTFDGRTQTSTQWAHELGVVPNLIASRLSRGWSVEQTLTTPRMNRGIKILL